MNPHTLVALWRGDTNTELQTAHQLSLDLQKPGAHPDGRRCSPVANQMPDDEYIQSETL